MCVSSARACGGRAASYSGHVVEEGGQAGRQAVSERERREQRDAVGALGVVECEAVEGLDEH